MAVLETERTILRPFMDSDAADLYEYARDPQVGPIAGWKPHESVEESLEIIRTVFAAPNVFAVVDKATGKVIGSAGFVGRGHGDGAGPSDEIGYALGPAFWGQGIMPEVVDRLVDYGFRDLGLHEIWCTHYEENHRSRRVIAKCGFTYVFTERLSDEFAPDRPTLFYVLLRREWEKGEGALDSYLVPFAQAEAELVEKRSRFIGRVWRVESEEEARACIEQTKKKHYDARHNCWCYIIREGGVLRYSDDGEPQGTAGQPMLNVFQREEVTNVCCVVTRYFGGILLGAGGLTRAYGGTAKLALDAAGLSRMRLWASLAVPCSYPLYERMRLLAEQSGGVIIDTDFGADVVLTVQLPAEDVDAFREKVTELSAGGIDPLLLEEAFQPGPREAAR